MNYDSYISDCFCNEANAYPASFDVSELVSYVNKLYPTPVIWHESVLSISAINTYASISMRRNLYWIIILGNGQEHLRTVFFGTSKRAGKDPDHVIWISFADPGTLCKEYQEQVKAMLAPCTILTWLKQWMCLIWIWHVEIQVYRF